jgi:ketosteroid isomerase-like protein
MHDVQHVNVYIARRPAEVYEFASVERLLEARSERISWRQAMAQHQAVSVETLKTIADAFNAHDLDAIMEFFADECSLDMPRGPEPWGQRFVGKAAVREGLATRFKGLPDVHYSDDRHWVSGSMGVSEWLLTGTTPEGRRVRVRGCDHWEFRDGKVARKDSYWKIVEKPA